VTPTSAVDVVELQCALVGISTPDAGVLSEALEEDVPDLGMSSLAVGGLVGRVASPSAVHRSRFAGGCPTLTAVLVVPLQLHLETVPVTFLGAPGEGATVGFAEAREADARR